MPASGADVPSLALRCFGFLNSLCSVANYIQHGLRLGEHRDVAGAQLDTGGAPALTRAGSLLKLPSSAALSTKATSRGFFPGAKVTVRDDGAASGAVSWMKFLRRFTPSRPTLSDNSVAHFAKVRC
jgi:hypothetical protein